MRFATAAMRAALALALAALPALALGDALTDRATALLERSDAKAAYELLLPLESQRAGDPEFDYLFGIAALGSMGLGGTVATHLGTRPLRRQYFVQG